MEDVGSTQCGAEEEQRALEPVRATVNVVAEEEVADVAGACAKTKSST